MEWLDWLLVVCTFTMVIIAAASPYLIVIGLVIAGIIGVIAIREFITTIGTHLYMAHHKPHKK